MSERRGRLGGLALWLGWWVFWVAVFYLGLLVQTWVFGDKTDPKPPFFDLVYPLHFWAPATLFYWPILVLERSMPDLSPGPAALVLMLSAAVAWAAIVSGLLVWIERKLLPRISPPISAWVLAGTVVALVALRLFASEPPSRVEPPGLPDYPSSAISYDVLTGLVVATYAAIALGLVLLAARWVWWRARRP